MPTALKEANLKRLIKPEEPPLVFLETASFNQENKTSLLFSGIEEVITFDRGDDLSLFFKKLENALKKGFWLCGYFSYEFGYFLEPAFAHLRERTVSPLAWLGAAKAPFIIDHRNGGFPANGPLAPKASYRINNLRPNLSESDYRQAIRKIKRYLEEGLTYQVNFTFKIKFNFTGSIIDLYLNLRRAQPTAYLALINTGTKQILSFSPELFFLREKEKIVSRPMKGTAKRGRLLGEDKNKRAWLKANKKIKAENIMIVDLLRNDLGKISKSVSAPKLFEIEQYRTLHQMTSTIEGKLKGGVKIKDIFSALFPCGSVTGAPKIKTMKLIAQLEKEPRGVYTGAIGYISPAQKMCFNVAIRTVSLESGKGELGVGGGIVYDSIGKKEYEEAALKAKFALEKFPFFSLVETIRWQEDKGYFLLKLHLARLSASAKYFSIPLDQERLKRDLNTLSGELKKIVSPKKEKFKVRVSVNLEGRWQITREPLGVISLPLKVRLSTRRVDPKNTFLYHKTTQRGFYDAERKEAEREGFFEAVFLNSNCQLTEGTISNIFVLKKGRLYTPPISCGLLGGVLRKHLLREGRAEEKILIAKDLWEAEKVYLGNSVRGLLAAKVYLANPEKKSKIKINREAKKCAN